MKIRGNTVGTNMKRPDFNNPKSILNNPIPAITEGDEGKTVKVQGGKYVLTDMPTGGGGGYSKEEIDAMFGSYVNDIANLIGGEALDES